ncbi:ATP-binding cassette domain-containing protein [Bacillus sp. 1P06AnD]|uniref:ABC transporter ATP-binding protein n=1 Tax=Bacillus sp. 1P06AnD TaxID=3132208 RepID=UPI0039A3D5CF
MTIFVNNLTKTFKGYHAVNHISTELEHGRCFALIGSNGAGKTTFLNMIAGIVEPTEGTISLHKEKDWKKRIGYLPQVPHFFEEMTAYEFLLFAGKISGIHSRHLQNRIDEVLLLTGISDAANEKIIGFSGGMKQRLGIAQAVLHKPEILLLDEPVSALDPIGRRECMNILSTLKKTTTIIYSTHVLHDAEEISDDVLLMKKGKLIAKDPLKQILKQSAGVLSVETRNDSMSILSSSNITQQVKRFNGNRFEVKLKQEYTKEDFLRWCFDQGVDIVSFNQNNQSLEDVFMEVMGK